MEEQHTTIRLELDEVRRLTGPNLLSNDAGAIIDVFIEGIDPQTVVDCWHKHLHTIEQQLNWNENTYVRFYEGGASMSISAPIDLLYSACDVIELAWECCVLDFNKRYSLPSDTPALANFSSRVDELKTAIIEERNPALIAFVNAATDNNVRCLVDDDEVSLGTGTSAQTWPIDSLPDTKEVEWQSFRDIPLALITGTNGKSTSVRLAAQIAKAANLNAGVTSTDFIKVGEQIIDEGDYSGPGGARMLLRDNRTEIAFLEVARGGLLRRGLPVYQANAALVTNVASDHLGQYGINTVDEIAQVKLMVAKAIRDGDTLVLNADDERLVKFSDSSSTSICWFSKRADNPQIVQAKATGRACVYADNNQIMYFDGAAAESLAQIDLIPMTVKGTALHNLENALGVVGLCKSMGIESEAISQGLFDFESNASDNPGRTNIYTRGDATIIVDFAHNPHSMQAVINMALGLKQKNDYSEVTVLFGHAGDRTNLDITNVADAVIALQPDTYILTELDKYLRGRHFGEISDVVEQHLLANGVKQAQIKRADSPLKGTKIALSQSVANDGVGEVKGKDTKDDTNDKTIKGKTSLILLFALAEREAIQALIEST
ncbi:MULTISPECIES: Mur ligase family protein [unclassified Alteromonas]|uniref:Mur ligase family protein n=1 Tax=unclassified Alteromonas TaxID=2614992 RepID=UPI0009DEC84C|nr:MULTISPECIES: Mur ligase family protein [unclassified Alteromonas]